ncbi:MAG: T9SS type A sorting domain-containing protein [Bacteroidetes bacterium]|nr:T9SS type A sorting domain-containing protein [Bacteroidota bacterium]
MKTRRLPQKLMFAIAAWLCLVKLNAQNVFIPDPNFKTYLQTNYASCMVGPNNDSLNTQCGPVLTDTILDVTALNISDLTGVQYFTSLIQLSCDSNQLSSLPSLPPTLKYLKCGWNQLTNLPTLPSSLLNLQCFYNQLTSIPSLPLSLISLYCQKNQLSNLPSLPSALWSLSCSDNQLTVLPSLPSGLYYLECSSNQLSSLPTLPNSLNTLDCANNLLTSLPSLPASLLALHCSNNQLISLPTLPNSLSYLNCASNPIACLPILPSVLGSNGYTIPLSISCIPNQPVQPIFQGSVVVSLPICTPANNACTYANISGLAFHDTNSNCQYDNGELLLKNRIIELQKGASTFYATTDSNGYYYSNIDTGVYNVSHVNNQFYNGAICSGIPYTVIVTSLNNSISNIDFPVQVDSCNYLSVDIATVRQRVGITTNQYYVNYCNNGVSAVSNAYIEITFAPEVFPLSSTLPWSGVNNATHTYTFTIGTINAMDCGTFIITDSVDVNGVLNQAVCATATIFPIDTACYQASSNWSKAFLKVNGNCNGTSIDFQIENIGTGNMGGGKQFRVYEDDLLVMNPNMPALNSLAVFNYSVAVTGKTYRLEVDQEPGAPGNSRPRAIVELCGGTNPSTGHVTSVSPDDWDAYVETSCIQLVNSYDPNDKKVMPAGFTSNNYVYNNDELEYTIQFQNTGNDTAYIVTLSDSIDVAHLDIKTIEPGVSSHPYQMQLWGANEVIFKFNNINLLPASVDSIKSQGFVKFKIKQQPNNPVGTDIDNKAYIYFDYNTPIITNVANVEIYKDPILLGVSKHYNNTSNVNLYPNPFTNELNVSVGGQYKQTRFELYDIVGKQLLSQTGGNLQKVNIQQALISGVYIYKVYGDEELISSGKVIAK